MATVDFETFVTLQAIVHGHDLNEVVSAIAHISGHEIVDLDADKDNA